MSRHLFGRFRDDPRKPKITAEQKKLKPVSSGRKYVRNCAQNSSRNRLADRFSGERGSLSQPQILSVGFWEDFTMTPNRLCCANALRAACWLVDRRVQRTSCAAGICAVSAIGLLAAKDFAALTVKNAQSDRSRRPFETCRGDDCGRHIRHLNLDFLQRRRSAIWRCTDILGLERVRRGGDDARPFVCPPQFGRGFVARATLPCRDRERERHSSPAVPGGLRPRGFRSGVSASPTRPQSRAISSELASYSRRRASPYAASPKTRISTSASASMRSILARRWGNQDSIGGLPGSGLPSIRERHPQRMPSGQFPRQWPD